MTVHYHVSPHWNILPGHIPVLPVPAISLPARGLECAPVHASLTTYSVTPAWFPGLLRIASKLDRYLTVTASQGSECGSKNGMTSPSTDLVKLL